MATRENTWNNDEKLVRDADGKIWNDPRETVRREWAAFQRRDDVKSLLSIVCPRNSSNFSIAWEFSRGEENSTGKLIAEFIRADDCRKLKKRPFRRLHRVLEITEWNPEIRERSGELEEGRTT